jgi:excisionase family DNA binding protein
MAYSALRALDVDEPTEGADVIQVAEACRLLGVHRNTLYRLIRDEQLPAFKMSRGGQWRLRRTHLREWLEDKQGVRQP